MALRPLQSSRHSSAKKLGKREVTSCVHSRRYLGGLLDLAFRDSQWLVWDPSHWGLMPSSHKGGSSFSREESTATFSPHLTPLAKGPSPCSRCVLREASQTSHKAITMLTWMIVEQGACRGIRILQWQVSDKLQRQLAEKETHSIVYCNRVVQFFLSKFSLLQTISSAFLMIVSSASFCCHHASLHAISFCVLQIRHSLGLPRVQWHRGT